MEQFGSLVDVVGGPPSNLAERVLYSCSQALYPHLHPTSRNSLRLVCSTARAAVDTCVHRLCCKGGIHETSDLPQPEPWPHAKQLAIHSVMDFGLNHFLCLHLEHLQLTDCLYHPDEEALAPLSTLAPNLRYLKLNRNKFNTDTSSNALASVLSTLTFLQHLHIERCSLQDEHLAQALAPALPSLPQLTHLEVSELYAEVSALNLISAISGLSRLEHLRLDIVIPSTAAQALLPTLAALPKLTALDVGVCLLLCSRVNVVQPVCEALACMPQLQSLSLANHSSMEHLHLIPTHKLSALRTLSLKGSPYVSYGAPLGRVLCGLLGLTSLDLSHNSIHDEEWECLGPALGSLTGLQQLYLRSFNSRWGAGPGAQAMAVALAKLQSLKVLSLIQSAGLVVTGASCTLPAISELGSSLERLDLEWSHKDAKEVKEAALPLLLQTLRKMKRLRTLHFNEFAFQDWAEIAAALPTSLRSLTVGNSLKWDEKARVAVLSALSRLPVLEHLDISCAYLKPEQVPSLLPALSALTALRSFRVSRWWQDTPEAEGVKRAVQAVLPRLDVVTCCPD